MITNPELVLMIHDTMVEDERRKAALPRVPDQSGPMSTVRNLTGNALISLGTRIAPAPRRHPRTSQLPTVTAPANSGV